MKTFLASKRFNYLNLSLFFPTVGKPRIFLRAGSRCCRVVWAGKLNTGTARSRWQHSDSSFLSQPSLPSCYKVLQCARQIHINHAFLNKEEKKPETLQDLVEAAEKPQTAVTVGQKVVQAGKDVSYFGILLAGFAVTGALLWYILSELFLSSSPNKIYADALKKVKNNEEVMDALGHPIKAYGEETSRGRRRHVSFQEYIVGGENYMRVKFYAAGQLRKGTVHVDVKQVGSRKFEYRFIFIELDGFPPRTIVIEDNR